MPQELGHKFETDDRFPTGDWKGFWLQRPARPERQRMDLTLSFESGKIRGEGNDVVGAFAMQGRYDVKTGKVIIHKYYVGQHHVLYEGWAEPGKGIWGVWKISPGGKDGFHMWPRSMRDPSRQELEAHAPESRSAEKVKLVDV